MKSGMTRLRFIAAACMLTVLSALLVLLALPAASAWAAGPPAANLIFVADTRELTGLMLWWSNKYNESHLQFTLLTITIIPVAGVILGWIADIVMSRIGIDLTKRKVSEK
jgi:hypothetical protein